MEENPQRNAGRSRPVSESDFVPAVRELVPTPVVRRSGDVSHAVTTFMVLRSSAILITKTKTRTEMIAISLLKLKLELKYSKKLKLYKKLY